MVILGTAWGHLPSIQKPQSDQKRLSGSRHKQSLSFLPWVLHCSVWGSAGRLWRVLTKHVILDRTAACGVGRPLLRATAAFYGPQVLHTTRQASAMGGCHHHHRLGCTQSFGARFWNAMGNEEGGSCWWTCYVPGFVLGGLHICLLIYSVQYPCQGGGIHPTPQMKYKRLRERRLVLSHSWCMAELEFKPSCV